MQLTPVLFVETIEPCLDFWEKGLGFKRLGEVPGEAGLVFVMLGNDAAQVMYQTHKSLVDDLPELAASLTADYEADDPPVSVRGRTTHLMNDDNVYLDPQLNEKLMETKQVAP